MAKVRPYSETNRPAAGGAGRVADADAHCGPLVASADEMSELSDGVLRQPLGLSQTAVPLRKPVKRGKQLARGSIRSERGVRSGR